MIEAGQVLSPGEARLMHNDVQCQSLDLRRLDVAGAHGEGIGRAASGGEPQRLRRAAPSAEARD